MTATTVATTKNLDGAVPLWAVALQGIFATIIGFLLVISPGATVLVMVQFLGFYWLIGGIISIIGIFQNRTRWGLRLLSGVLGILAGFAVIQNPLWSTILVPSILVIALGVNGILIGVVLMILAFQGSGFGSAILGLLSIFLGMVLLGNPLISAATLAVGLGVIGIVGGIASIIYSLIQRSVKS